MTESFDEASKVKVSPSVYARAFGDEVVLLDFGKGEYFGLDAIGADVWRRIEAGDSLGAIAERIASTYEVGREEALRDILDLVAQLRSNDLVVPA